MSDEQTVNIDLTKLSDVAHKGVRRAVLFMGFGLNAAHRENFNDYELHKVPIVPGQTSLPVEFFSSNLPAHRAHYFKKEFATWVVGCGLGELLEHYALFLDHVHRYSLLVYHVRGKLGNLDPKKEQERFNRRLGIPDKLRTLSNRFVIKPENSESINQLYHARNCLTHDLGRVSPKRCGPNGQFALTWKALEVFARGEESGIEYPATQLIGKTTEEPVLVCLRQVKRVRKFVPGAKLVLSQQDLWEICYFFNAHARPSAVDSFVRCLEAHQVPVTRHA